jgi:hypothetical protein
MRAAQRKTLTVRRGAHLGRPPEQPKRARHLRCRQVAHFSDLVRRAFTTLTVWPPPHAIDRHVHTAFL